MSVTFSWNLISVSSVTFGATNSQTGVFTPFKLLLDPSGICLHEYDKIIPFGDLLFDPLRITVDPALTTWLAPALAIGGSCKDWCVLMSVAVCGDEVELFGENGDTKANGVELT